jgi:quercetin dioxygenase-like cupin family protein
VGLVRFERDAQNLVSGTYSQGRGPVLRSEHLEVTKIAFAVGEGAAEHAHPEEQVLYVLSGRVRVTLGGPGGEVYEVGPGEATFNPSNVPHELTAVEDTVALSLKNQIAPVYDATGELA